MNDFGMSILGLTLFLLAGFFVAIEFAIVAVKKGRLETQAKKGSKAATRVLQVIAEMDRYVAGIQIWITGINLGIGSFLEPWISSRFIDPILKNYLPEGAIKVISIIIVSFPLVVVGELVPKYLALKYPEKSSMLMVSPLRFFTALIQPLVWLFEKSGLAVLKLLRIDPDGQPTFVREEIQSLIRASEGEGGLDESHSQLVARALRLDTLDAEDAMIHRLDMKWLDSSLSRAEALEQVKEITHTRIPVCNSDVDDVVGILYLHDLVKADDSPDFDLKELCRPAVYVPENLSLDRMVTLMRDQKTQIVIVTDEYGGTSGLVTLEDVVEEIFGDLEDKLEAERAAIEQTSAGRLSVKWDVRYDEVLDYCDIEATDEDPWTTESLASIVVDELGRVPKVGDGVETPIGRIRVDSMARGRITRLGVFLKKRLEE